MNHRPVEILLISRSICFQSIPAGQQEDYLYAVLATNLLIPWYSAESNVLITSSQSFRLAFACLRLALACLRSSLFTKHATRHDNNNDDNRDDNFSLKLLSLIIIVNAKEVDAIDITK